MKKAALYEEIGSEWFHPRVHDAVLHCLRHELANDQPTDFLLPDAASGGVAGLSRVDETEGEGDKPRNGQSTSVSSTATEEEDERWYVAPEAESRLSGPQAEQGPPVRARYLSVVPPARRTDDHV